jgi:KaiC/GvpD/RAD55 family RecA-like ATPase
MKADRRGDEIPPQAPEWAMEGRLPRGEVSLIVGRDGTGKSTLMTALAAAWTRGELTGKPERVHLNLAEDDVAAVTVPRLRAAGADMGEIRFLAEGDEWSFPRDTDRLHEYVVTEKIDIVVLDPLDHHASGINGTKAREILDGIRRVTRETGVTIIIVHHFTKTGGTVDIAIGGGRAVKAIARSILVWGPVLAQPVDLPSATGDDPDEEPEWRPCAALAHHKCSYGPLQKTLLYARNDNDPPGFDLIGDCEFTVLDVFAAVAVPTAPAAAKRNVARDLILRFLAGIERTGEDLASDVMAAGISRTTFERARAELASEGLIEQFQRDRRHRWRIAVPIAPPEELR